MSAAPFEDSPDYVQSLARGLSVLRAFGHDLPSPSLSEVATRTGLSRAVARRSLMTLQHLGYVGNRGRQFFLTPRVLELGYRYLSSLDLTELAQRAMEQLAQQVDESCSMAVLDGGEIVYVQRVPVRRVMSIALGVGARLPAAPTSLGRVLLADLAPAARTAWLQAHPLKPHTPHTITEPGALGAELDKVGRQGHALAVQELELGLCSIAVPIHAADGRVVAGLNVGMPYRADSRQRAREQILPALRATQQVIEQAIRESGWMPALHGPFDRG
jgi:IclR family transcriptional regulator, pca regulon regulatory protein